MNEQKKKRRKKEKEREREEEEKKLHVAGFNEAAKLSSCELRAPDDPLFFREAAIEWHFLPMRVSLIHPEEFDNGSRILA